MNEPKSSAAGEPRRAEGRISPAPTPAPGTLPPRPVPHRVEPAAPTASDARKASEIRKPGSVQPHAPRPAPAHVSNPDLVEEDPEKLLREYAERQKTKVLRLEQQLNELRKVQAERDAYRAKGETLAKELTDARKQLEASSKADAVIKDLQGKVDAALLSSTMDRDELGKLRAKNEALEAAVKKVEEKAAHFEKMLTEAQKQLVAQTEGRREAEARVAAALQALQGEISKAQTVKMAPAEPPSGTRHGDAAPAPAPAKPTAQHAAAHASAPKPGAPVARK